MLKSKSVVSCFLAAVIILFIVSPTFASVQDIPLTVSNPTDNARVSDIVTSGVPLPKEANILNTDDLSVSDSSGNIIPAQISVLARWDGQVSDTSKPIRWALLDFQASIAANASETYF
ncbi:MAG: hypothetical protein HC887_00150 [Desulfobacteraceae bacterium]|nr:hypothetical protein [Desulfobacteraceae bacterium]